MITGKLTNAGTMQVGHDGNRTGLFIETTHAALRWRAHFHGQTLENESHEPDADLR